MVAWSAVAVNVALARFLQGKRDFVPDVIEALRGNEVPDELLAAVRRVPIPERAVAGTVGSVPGRAADDAEAALRLAYHEPLLERGLRAIAEGGRTAGRAAAGRRAPRCPGRGRRRARRLDLPGRSGHLGAARGPGGLLGPPTTIPLNPRRPRPRHHRE